MKAAILLIVIMAILFIAASMIPSAGGLLIFCGLIAATFAGLAALSTLNNASSGHRS